MASREQHRRPKVTPLAILGTVLAWVEQAAQRAAAINGAQDRSQVRVGLHDEIFQGGQPVLTGIDAASTCCYLLQGVEQRDADTWGIHLLDSGKRGLDSDFTVADVALACKRARSRPDFACRP
jgi:hypothetical protein